MTPVQTKELEKSLELFYFQCGKFLDDGNKILNLLFNVENERYQPLAVAIQSGLKNLTQGLFLPLGEEIKEILQRSQHTSSRLIPSADDFLAVHPYDSQEDQLFGDSMWSEKDTINEDDGTPAKTKDTTGDHRRIPRRRKTERTRIPPKRTESTDEHSKVSSTGNREAAGHASSHTDEEKRQEVRHQKQLSISYRPLEWNKEYQTVSRDISPSGIFIVSKYVEKIGRELVLKVELPDGAITEIRGTVKWKQWVPPLLRETKSPGFGVEIVEAPQEWFDYLSSSHPQPATEEVSQPKTKKPPQSTAQEAPQLKTEELPQPKRGVRSQKKKRTPKHHPLGYYPPEPDPSGYYANVFQATEENKTPLHTMEYGQPEAIVDNRRKTSKHKQLEKSKTEPSPPESTPPSPPEVSDSAPTTLPPPMEDNSEKRKMPRYEARFSFRCEHPEDGTKYQIVSKDIGPMGIYALSPYSEEIGQHLILNTELPNGIQVKLQGVVVWSKTLDAYVVREEKHGFGVQIMSAPEAWYSYFFS